MDIFFSSETTTKSFTSIRGLSSTWNFKNGLRCSVYSVSSFIEGSWADFFRVIIFTSINTVVPHHHCGSWMQPYFRFSPKRLVFNSWWILWKFLSNIMPVKQVFFSLAFLHLLPMSCYHCHIIIFINYEPNHSCQKRPGLYRIIKLCCERLSRNTSVFLPVLFLISSYFV